MDRQEFYQSLHAALQDPESVWRPSLSLIYLVLANGLVMAFPENINEGLGRIVTDTRDHADLFFRSGSWLAEGTRGYDEGGIRPIQALLLKALYNFHVSKWKSAYVDLGKFLCQEKTR